MTRASAAGAGIAAVAVAFAAGWLVRDVTAPVGTVETASDAPAATSVRATTSPDADPARESPGDATTPRTSTPHEQGAPSEANGLTARRPGRADATPFRTAADFRQAIESRWDAAHPASERPLDDDFQFAAQEARARSDADHAVAARSAETQVEAQVRALAAALELRAQRGTASAGPLTIELRARGRKSVCAADRPGPLAAAPFEPAEAIRRENEGVGVVGPLPTRGLEFVLERIEVEAQSGRERHRTGQVIVGSAGWAWHARIAAHPVVAVFETSEVCDLERLRLEVTDASARVRFSGRAVPRGTPVERRPCVWVADRSRGFLRTETPVRVQIVADHGGGNPRTVDLAGIPNMYLDGTSDTPVWDDAADVRKLPSSRAWTSDAGLVPPGHVFRVQRIDWRVRLRGGERHSRFDVGWRGGRADLVAVGPPDDVPKDAPADVSGTWTGDLVVRQGEEDRLTITCHYFGMADVTVWGRLESTAK